MIVVLVLVVGVAIVSGVGGRGCGADGGCTFGVVVVAISFWLWLVRVDSFGGDAVLLVIALC